jgi:hypothetical protein
MEHIKTKCGTEWFERRGEEMNGTVEMVMGNMESDNDWTFVLPDTTANVSFILGPIVICFLWIQLIFIVSLLINDSGEKFFTVLHTQWQKFGAAMSWLPLQKRWRMKMRTYFRKASVDYEAALSMQ